MQVLRISTLVRMNNRKKKEKALLLQARYVYIDLKIVRINSLSHLIVLSFLGVFGVTAEYGDNNILSQYFGIIVRNVYVYTFY